MKDKHNKCHVGVNIFVVRDKKLLLGKRKNGYGEGSWGLPGGHLEYQESMKAAAQRELAEETGLSSVEFEFVGLVNDAREDDQHYLQVGFLAKGVGNAEPALKEPERCEEWQWFDLNNLPEQVFAAHIQLVEAFKKGEHFADKRSKYQ